MRRKSGFIKKLKKNKYGFCHWPIRILYEIILIFNLRFDGDDDLCDCGECCCSGSDSSKKKESSCCDCCCECL